MVISTVATNSEGKPYFEKTVKADGSETVTTRIEGREQTFLSNDADGQKAIALKLIGFFLVFIVVCLGALYAYHRISQRKQQVQKNNFFEFLAGQLEDEYPSTAHYMK